MFNRFYLTLLLSFIRFYIKDLTIEQDIFKNKEHKLSSYKISFLIAKKHKYFAYGQFLRECILTACHSLFPTNPEIKDKF